MGSDVQVRNKPIRGMACMIHFTLGMKTMVKLTTAKENKFCIKQTKLS